MNKLTRWEVRLGFWFVALVALFAAWTHFERNVRAQEEQPADVAAEAEQPAAAAEAGENHVLDWSRSLGGMIVKSGWIGIPFYIFLGLLSLWAMSVAIERLIRLVPNKVMPAEFVAGLQGLIRGKEDDEDSYRDLCNSHPSPIAHILKAGLSRAGRTLMEVEKAMEDSAAREIGELRSRHQPLNVVGSVAPLVGLLGTVVGMIFAFYQSSQAGLGKAEVLAEYIYLALITTAMGLTIAIPSLLLAAWFNARVERFMRDMDECLLDMMPVFIRMEQREQAGGDVYGTEPEFATPK